MEYMQEIRDMIGSQMSNVRQERSRAEEGAVAALGRRNRSVIGPISPHDLMW